MPQNVYAVNVVVVTRTPQVLIVCAESEGQAEQMIEGMNDHRDVISQFGVTDLEFTELEIGEARHLSDTEEGVWIPVRSVYGRPHQGE